MHLHQGAVSSQGPHTDKMRLVGFVGQVMGEIVPGAHGALVVELQQETRKGKGASSVESIPGWRRGGVGLLFGSCSAKLPARYAQSKAFRIASKWNQGLYHALGLFQGEWKGGQQNACGH